MSLFVCLFIRHSPAAVYPVEGCPASRSGSACHCLCVCLSGIRQLQCILLKVALLAGVEVNVIVCVFVYQAIASCSVSC